MKTISDVLYLHAPEFKDSLHQELDRNGGRPSLGPRGDSCIVVESGSYVLRLLLITDIKHALALLSDHYFSFVVVDTRLENDCKLDRNCTPQSLEFIERIHYSADPDKRFPLSRIFAVLQKDDHLAEHCFELGKLRIGGYVVDPFSGSLAQLMERQYDPDQGKTAICLSGGGIEGFLYELGVMMALNAHLQSRSVTDIDIFCGVSAGAILASLLANLDEPEMVTDAFFNRRGDKEDVFLTKNVFNFNRKEIFHRILSLAKTMPTLSGAEFLSALLRAVPIGFFRGDGIHEFMERYLTKRGRTNNFRKLERELYVGATDQDRSSHIVFGDGQWKDVPISKAVQASASLTPFFEPAYIEERYFVDGQYTRTSNFHVAVEKGAKLVIVVNPLVPIKVEGTGYVRRKGGVFGGLQGLKAVVHTRFLHAFQAAVDSYPDVDFILFEPEGNLLKLMGGSPMKYQLRTEIVNLSYRLSVQRIQRDFELLEGTFARHDFRLQRHPRLRTQHMPVF